MSGTKLLLLIPVIIYFIYSCFLHVRRYLKISSLKKESIKASQKATKLIDCYNLASELKPGETINEPNRCIPVQNIFIPDNVKEIIRAQIELDQELKEDKPKLRIKTDLDSEFDMEENRAKSSIHSES